MKHLSTLTTFVLGGFLLSSCGAATETEGPTEDEQLVEVSVGVLPIASSSGIHYGIEEGIFEDHGFDVELVVADSGAALVPGVSNEQMTFGLGNPLALMTAVEQGLELKILAGYARMYAEGEDSVGVVTRADSDIDTFGDLEGKTTVVNALQSQGDITIKEAAERDGADPAALDFAELAYPDMPAQLELGNVDAIWTPEPYFSRALEDPNNELLGYNFQESVPGAPAMVTFTSGDFAEENPEVVSDFADAMRDALSQANENLEDTKALIPEFIDVPQEEAADLKMEDLSGEIPEDEIESIGELAQKFGVFDDAPDLDDLLVQ